MYDLISKGAGMCQHTMASTAAEACLWGKGTPAPPKRCYPGPENVLRLYLSGSVALSSVSLLLLLDLPTISALYH